MAKMDPNQNNYYPHYDDGKLKGDFKKVFDHIYELQSQLREAHSRLAKHADASAAAKEPAPPGGASSTKIAGLYVIGQPPADADRLTYDAATGQIVWKP